MDTDLGFFAVAPLWLRLVVLYIAVGLALSHYEERRAVGSGIATAIGETIAAALLAPVTAIRLVVAGWFTRKA